MDKGMIQDMLNKREAEIVKYKNYINEGKTLEDKIVSATIKKIKTAEKQLTEGNVEFIEFDPTNLDKDLTIKAANTQEHIQDKSQDNVKDTAPVLVLENKIENIAEVEKSEPKETEATTKKKKPVRKENISKKKLGVFLTSSISTKLTKFASLSNDNENTAVNELLKEMYDSEKKQFKIKIDNKDKKSKITSYDINVEVLEAIENLAIKTGYKKTEIFEMIIEKALDEYDI